MKLIKTMLLFALTQEKSAQETQEPIENENDNDQSNEEFETQTVETKLTVTENKHNMCDLGLVDQTTYTCDEQHEMLKCTASCDSGGIKKQNCECYKYWGPLVIYE